MVDQVEDKLLNYFRSQDLKVGDSIPNEIELSSALGVARSVLREALSRLKMMGMIESRTRRGMILTEPFILGGMKRVVDPRIMSQESLLDLLGFRVALEIGHPFIITLFITFPNRLKTGLLNFLFLLKFSAEHPLIFRINRFRLLSYILL